MKLIRNHPEARWLPSRSHFAIFRLYSFLRIPKHHSDSELPTVYVVDNQQNAVENFSVCTLVLIAIFCYLSVALERWLSFPAALVVSAVSSPVIAQVPFFVVGLLVMPFWQWVGGRKSRRNFAVSSFVTMSLMFAASTWFVARGGWTRPVAATVLALFGLNGIAAVVLRLLRDRIRDVETRCGA